MILKFIFLFFSSQDYLKIFYIFILGSWYLGLFSQSILKMQEGGKLSDLKRKWWKEKYAGSCTVSVFFIFNII